MFVYWVGSMWLVDFDPCCLFHFLVIMIVNWLSLNVLLFSYNLIGQLYLGGPSYRSHTVIPLNVFYILIWKLIIGWKFCSVISWQNFMLFGNVTQELLLIDANDCELSSLCFLQITLIMSFVKAADDSMMYLIAVNMLSKYKI